MKSSSILIVCKYSKIEYDQNKYKINAKKLIRKYEKEGVFYNTIKKSHREQRECIKLVANLLPNAKLIYTNSLNKKLSKDKDLIISVGGDEHFKYVIHNSLNNKKFLSIRSDNLKSEGALSSCNKLNLNTMITQIKNNNYKLEKWTRLHSKLDGKSIPSAIDTIFIGSKNATRMSRYIIKYKNQKEEQKSSGLLIITGAGSTGWYHSTGGNSFPKHDKIGKFTAREIYVGTKTGNKIRSGQFTNNEEIEITSLMDSEGIVEIDSIKECRFKRGSVLKVRVAKNKLSVISIQ